jgi:hypothetical protein
MKLLLLLSLILLASPCYAWDDADPRAWTTAEVAMESGIFALAGVATLRTYALMDRGEYLSEGTYQSDILPVAGYTAAAAIGHAVITHWIPRPYRKYWQIMGLGASAGYVGFVFTQEIP